MAVVIRLQGLSMAAGSQDIRKFFGGLRIPDGGVHIVGGELNEAFIIFGSDEDARIAMTKSGDYIKGSSVKLLLSSKTEMQNILERSTESLFVDQRKIPRDKPRHLEMGKMSSSRRSAVDDMGGRSSGQLGRSPSSQNWRASDFGKEERQLLLRGMPFSASKDDVWKFFAGLIVNEIVLMQNHRGQNNGNGLVTFASKEDASEGLKRHREYMGPRFVEVYTLQEWLRVFGELPMGVTVSGMTEKQQRSPHHSRENSQYRKRSRSPLGCEPLSSSTGDYCVLLENLSHSAEKRDIMKFFNRARLDSDQILYLCDDSGSRTRSAFVLFKSLQDYRNALDRDNMMIGNRNIGVRPISREKMIMLLEGEKPKANLNEKNCIHVKFNVLDVRKTEIMDFFCWFNLSEEDVIILRDHKGNDLGEGVVSFQTGDEALEAFSLNGKRFLGSEVHLRLLYHSEVREILNGSSGSKSSETRHSNRDLKRSEIEEVHILPNRSQRDEHSRGSRDFTRGSGGDWDSRADFRRPDRDAPTSIKLINLPYNIKVEEVYDFCYGYRIIPGSVSLQFDKHGNHKGTATVEFETRQEALAAIDDLTGRPIGPRKIQLILNY